MKEFKVLMDKHQNLEAARIEYEERGKLSESIWEKIKGCENSIKELAGDRGSIVLELMDKHPYAALVAWFMEKKEDISKKITDKILPYRPEDREDFSFDLEMLFYRLEDVLIVKYHTDPILDKNKLKELTRNFSINLFENALDAIQYELPSNYEDEIPYLGSSVNYLKNMMSN